MAISDFYPFQPGQVVTPAQWNEMFTAIQNGSFFLDTTPISDQIKTLADRVSALELRVTNLEHQKSKITVREQFTLIQNQTYVQLTHTPVLDTENTVLNGMSLAKNGIPLGFVGDYYMSGSKVMFTSERILNVFNGDLCVVIYQYEV